MTSSRALPPECQRVVGSIPWTQLATSTSSREVPDRKRRWLMTATGVCVVMFMPTVSPAPPTCDLCE